MQKYVPKNYRIWMKIYSFDALVNFESVAIKWVGGNGYNH